MSALIPIWRIALPRHYLIVDPVSTMLTFERTVLLLDDGSIQIRVLVVNTDPTRALAGRVDAPGHNSHGKNAMSAGLGQ